MEVETLQRVRQYQAEHGHAKATIIDRHGRVCLLGAYVYSEQDRERRYDQLDFALSLGFPTVELMCIWNNQAHITLHDVLGRLDESIERLAAPDPRPLVAA